MADERREREVDDEDLNEERRAADHVHVNLGRNAQDRKPGELTETEDEAEDEAEADGERRDLQREACAAKQKRNAVEDEREIEFHGGLLFERLARAACLHARGQWRAVLLLC